MSENDVTLAETAVDADLAPASAPARRRRRTATPTAEAAAPAVASDSEESKPAPKRRSRAKAKTEPEAATVEPAPEPEQSAAEPAAEESAPAGPPIKVRVLILGDSASIEELPAGATLQLLMELKELTMKKVNALVNHQPADLSVELKEGDQVVFAKSVKGGA